MFVSAECIMAFEMMAAFLFFLLIAVVILVVYLCGREIKRNVRAVLDSTSIDAEQLRNMRLLEAEMEGKNQTDEHLPVAVQPNQIDDQLAAVVQPDQPADYTLEAVMESSYWNKRVALKMEFKKNYVNSEEPAIPQNQSLDEIKSK